jgi:hypothetical protein
MFDSPQLVLYSFIHCSTIQVHGLPPSDVTNASNTALPDTSANPVYHNINDTRRTTRAHTRRLLEGYRETFDALPEAPPPLPETSAPISSHSSTHIRIRSTPFETSPDSFGRFRIYPSKPLRIPDLNASLEDFTDLDLSAQSIYTSAFTPNANALARPLLSSSLADAIAPCPNVSTFYFLHWFWRGFNKSVASRNALLTDVLLRPDFNISDLAGVDLSAIDKELATTSHTPQGDGTFKKTEGWRERCIPIQVPISRGASNRGADTKYHIQVPGKLRFRNL